MSRTFKCDKCAGVFETEGSEGEAQAEYEEAFGKGASNDRASLCDDCYNEFMSWWEEEDE